MSLTPLTWRVSITSLEKENLSQAPILPVPVLSSLFNSGRGTPPPPGRGGQPHFEGPMRQRSRTTEEPVHNLDPEPGLYPLDALQGP